MNKTEIVEFCFLKAAEDSIFYITPYELFKNDIYKQLSANAGHLYGMMLSRLSLAKKLDLKDKDGKTYILFPQSSISELLGVSCREATNLVNELRKVSKYQWLLIVEHH